MERQSRRSAERIRVDQATERWHEAQSTHVRLWSELTDLDKERLAARRLRSLAGKLGWDAVLRHIGVGRRVED
ncbi:hypothetical protein EDC65_5018 [Stella humosa]|uniref:Uncharacterized protein n=1 Tax=Stella humosa TaxID=94 RepID=A0A3N1KHW6_9PROT|nr:hypothetical protein [Stella humosa]ROP81163.1 hypothetical protein EDC65_5018 [Stella humosa]BBK32509.1 hypothetical protein STHU_31430 [Stella humosa]